MNDFKIIPMSAQHVTAVAALEKLCFSDPWSENSVGSELDNPLSLWLVAMVDKTLVGYIGSQCAAGECDMMNLAVSPDFRGRGIALSLVEALISRLIAQDIEALMLEVRESNTPAIRLYEKLGFSVVGTRPNYYFHPKENALIMRKELK